MHEWIQEINAFTIKVIKEKEKQLNERMNKLINTCRKNIHWLSIKLPGPKFVHGERIRSGFNVISDRSSRLHIQVETASNLASYRLNEKYVNTYVYW